MILVGDKDNIIFGVFVNYKQETVDAYKTVLQDVFERALKLFYDTDKLEIPREKIEGIINSKEMKPIGLTYHSFMADLHLWRKLRIEKVLRLPLPPCNRALPYIHSFWNKNKGVSDTTTKLISHCPMQFLLPVNHKLLLQQDFSNYLLYSSIDKITGHEDLNKYCSLFHLRNTKNQTWQLWKNLEVLED